MQILLAYALMLQAVVWYVARLLFLQFSYIFVVVVIVVIVVIVVVVIVIVTICVNTRSFLQNLCAHTHSCIQQHTTTHTHKKERSGHPVL